MPASVDKREETTFFLLYLLFKTRVLQGLQLVIRVLTIDSPSSDILQIVEDGSLSFNIYPCGIFQEPL